MIRTAAALFVLVPLAACGDAAPAPAPAPASAPGADAGTNAALVVREQAVSAALSGVQLARDGKSLAFCTYRHEVGFIDTATLAVTQKIDLAASAPELAALGYCRMSLVGDDAYALFYPQGLAGEVAAVVRLSLHEQRVLGTWRLPGADAAVSADFFQTYQGIVDVGGRLVVTGSYGQPAGDGPALHFLDPSTGAVSTRVFPDGRHTEAAHVVASLGAGRVLGGSADGKGGGHDWILDVASGVFTSVEPAFSGNTAVEVDASTGRLILGYTPSRGLDVRRTADAAVVTHLEYPDPGFDTTLRFVAHDRIAVLSTGSQTSYMSVVDAHDGRPLAKAALGGPDVLDAVASADGTRLYAVGTDHVAEITLPTTSPRR